MRIALITNLTDRRCGITEWGLACAKELRKAGHEVLEVDGTYPEV